MPQPSDDPSDPLNWSFVWKMLSMGGMSVTAFSWTVGPLAISSQVPYYMAEWDRSLPDVIQFVSKRKHCVARSCTAPSDFLPPGRCQHPRPGVFQSHLGSDRPRLWAKTHGLPCESLEHRFNDLESRGEVLWFVYGGLRPHGHCLWAIRNIAWNGRLNPYEGRSEQGTNTVSSWSQMSCSFIRGAST